MLKHQLKERDVDGITAILNRLHSKDAHVRELAAMDLHASVATLARELTSETFARFLSDLTPRLQTLLQSTSLVDQLGGIAAVDALIPVASEVQIIRFANYLRSFFVTCESKAGLRAASWTLGRLASSTENGISGTLVAAFVDFEVKRAFEWLTNPCFQANHRRLAACMVLQALASAVPTLFHVNLTTFFVAIWPAIRDPRVDVRDAATDALAACLQLISMRQTRHRVQWYCKIYDQVQDGLHVVKGAPSVVVTKSPSWESIHGSLLVIGQLVQNTGSFMVPRFREVCDIVLCYKDAKDKLVARSVCLLLPQLAAYCPDAFVRHYLSVCVVHLMKRVTTFLSVSERGIAFLALGELALAVGDHLVPQLPSIIELLQDGMKKSKYFCIETLLCAAHFTKACTAAIEPYLPSLLDQMMAGGLNDTLVEALTEIIQTVPAVKTWVQERLLHEISLVLRRPAATPPDDQRKTSGFSTFSLPFRSEKPDDKDPTTNTTDAMLLLSLKTLGHFDFRGPFSILPFVQDEVSVYLTYPDVSVRKQAVVTCAKLCHPDPALSKRGRSGQVIDQMLQTLLQVGLTDLDWTVRKSVVESLLPPFDDWLAQESHVNLLFYLVNDEQAEIRELTMEVLDRLAGRNPAYILPLLRRVLIQLLTELEHALDLRMMEESTRLLSKLIHGSQHLVEPYLSRVLDVLLPKLQLQGNPNFSSAVLTALGSLAQAVQTQMAPFEPLLLPLILDALQDHSSLSKRHVALITLGQLTTSTGNVVQPYVTYPKVLHVLLDLLQHTAATPWSLRREAMRTMGILGALDPYKYKLCVARASTLELPDKPLPSTMDEEKQQIELQLFTAPPVGTRRRGNLDVTAAATSTAAAEEDPMHLALQQSTATPALSVSDDAYFPTVAIHALLGILREPSLAVHHYGVIQAIMFIFKSLSLQCVQFLPAIVPPFLHVLDKGEPRLRHSLFLQLTTLTSIVQNHLSPFFPAMVTLILRHWRAHLSPILQLIEKLARAAPSDFKQTYFPLLLPRLLEVLNPQPSSHGSGVIPPSSHPNEPSPAPLNPTGSVPASSSASSSTPGDALHHGAPGAIMSDLETPDNTGSGVASLQIQVVHVLLVCGPAVEDSVFVLMPALIRLLEHAETSWEAKTWIVGLLAHLTLLGPTFEHYIGPRLLLVLQRILRLHSTSEKTRKFTDAAVYCLGAIAFQLQEGWLSYKSLVESMLPFIPSADHVAAIQSWAVVLSQGQDKRITKDHVQAVLSPDLKTWYTAASATPSPELTPPATATANVMHVNQANLKRAWEASQRSTKEDWLEWMRRFSIELLRESPSAALRSCCSLAQAYNPLARALFNSAFVSCWNQLFEQYQDYLVRALETAFQSDTIPAEILQTLLNLAEFMEHDVEALPIDIRELGELAQKCHAYAKALHYKELEFHTSPSTCIEALISINNQVGQPEAAVGILKYAQWHHRSVIQVKESWFEKLQDWGNALQLYNVKLQETPNDLDACTGKMRCLEALGEWDELASLAKQVWAQVDHENMATNQHKLLKKSQVDESLVKTVALLGARACWWLSEWTTMEQYVSGVLTSGPSVGTLTGTPSSADTELNGLCALYKSVLAVHHNQFEEAQKWIDTTRKELDTTLGALVGESYLRAYHTMITLQQLSELEEIVAYKKICLHKPDEAPGFKRHMVKIWAQRLTGCKRVVEVWQHVLAVRSLVLSPHEDIDTWLQFASLCRQSGNLALSLKVFTHALSVRSHSTTIDDWRTSFTPVSFSSLGYSEKDPHRVAFAYLKHLWAVGEKAKALTELGSLVQTLSRRPTVGNQSQELVKCQLKWAEWQMAIHEQQLDRVSIPAVLAALKTSTELDPTSYKAWHAWALMNFQVVDHQPSQSARDDSYVVSAIEGFFRSIALGRSRWAANVQQDILRVLTLWFAHGHKPDVYAALNAGFQSVNIETWLIVIPQLIARIHSPHERIQKQLRNLLCAIGSQHPHALIYPLSVALKSPLEVRQKAAESIMDVMRRSYKNLVDEALLVSRELIRVAILWHEMWHEGLEEASRLYFGEHDVEGMMAVLKPLHVMMDKGPETMREVSFSQAFGRDLKEAYEWIQRYLNPQYGANEADLNRAWDLYYYVFKRINKQLPQLTTLELQYVSPNLLQAHNLQLAVPGTYRAGHDIIKIRSFVPTMLVLTSKQRPRRITINASNGLEYMFLLKGHEDLRQDERVTQLFGLVNALLINDRTTSKKDLKITRYPVIPLSHNAGIVGWVPNCDTLHQLIRDYREARKILLNIEHRLMLQMAPDYDVLSLMQKVEVFQYALENTAGQDLYKVLWLKSENSEIWLDRRTNYTRSLAAMSMVGYILGLGDRHPSNLMLHRFTGTIVHIDFGDCFEVAMHREKYPEKIPFRLTRMLTNAMEVSGIEGNFRFSCEAVMQVLRDNQHSLMAMLEAFVHDPLICWRLLAPNVSPPRLHDNAEDPAAPPRRELRDRRPSISMASLAMMQQNEAPNNIHVEMSQLAASLSRSVAASAAVDANGNPSISSSQVDLELRRSHRERELVNALGPEGAGAPREALNEKAVAVTRRVQSKLTGRDFFDDDSEPLNVAAQVQRLITQAASHENLCQCYIGWCPFW